MPNYGETKNVQSKMSKSQIESKVGKLGVINNSVVGLVIDLGATLGLAAAKATLGVSLGATVGLTTIKEGLKVQESTLKSYLELIAKNKASGITVTIPYQYRYMNGSGTGWYIVGRTALKTY